MVCHTFIIRRVYITHVNKRVAHLIFAAVDKSIYNAIDALVAHDVYVYSQAFCIRLAGYLSQFVFFPVGDALMSVRIHRLNKSRAALDRAVN